MAAMEITGEARQQIAFTKPYIRMPSAFVTVKRRAGPWIQVPAGLVGKAIGVEAGGTPEAYKEDVYKQSEIRPYATLDEAILDLAEGRARRGHRRQGRHRRIHENAKRKRNAASSTRTSRAIRPVGRRDRHRSSQGENCTESHVRKGPETLARPMEH